MIKVYCNGTRIQCLRQGELTAGMVGAPIEFDFSEEWNGLGKTAVFRCDGARDVIVGADGVAVVPHEILTTPGMDVEVGVYAAKEDGTTWPAPTPFCRIGRVKEGADPSGDESYPPTPDVGAQAVAAASSAMQAAAAAQEVAAEIQRRADNGEFDGKDGDDYVLTEADKVEIAEIAADLVDVPEGKVELDTTLTQPGKAADAKAVGDALVELEGKIPEGGGSADLTGYATEEWVKAGYQPKGNYLTEVPAGYAKTEDIPTKPSDIGAQPAGSYLTAVPAGYATEEYVRNKIAEAELGGEEVDLSGYAQKSELPTKVSQLENDKGYLTEHQDISGKLDASALPTAINTALAQAKASGEFDGKDGQDGSPGKDGVSATHTWNGTTLIVTSASGTSSADLKGDKGDTGAAGSAGKDGSNGKDGTSVTVKSVSESTADGGSNVVTFSDGKTLTVKNGSKGSTGAAGKDGSPGTDGINGADGYTPVRGKDYYTEADKAEFANYIATELAKRGQLEPLYVDSIEKCTDTTKLYVLPDGFIYAWMLTEKEAASGGYTNLLPTAKATDRKTIYGGDYNGDGVNDGYLQNRRLSSSGSDSERDGCCCTGFISAKEGDILRMTGWQDASGVSIYVNTYKSDNTFVKSLAYGSYAADGYTYVDGLFEMPLTSGKFGTGFDSVRISSGSMENLIITINEEIKEGGTTIVKEYAWASTGHAFVPADYEDRIIAVEKTAMNHTARIVALEKSVESGGADETEAAALSKIQKWDKPVYDPAHVTLIADSRVKPALTTNDRTISAIYAKYRALMAAHPDYITEINMGKSSASDTFTAVDMLRFDFCEPSGLTQPDMADSGRHETKPTLIFLSGIHTEWAGVWGLYYALEEIATNPDFDDVRRNARIVVIPCANPFCLTSQTAVDGWRMSHVNANGVAIHNNFGVNHSTSGAVGEYNYGGSAPYSEPETQYIDAVMAEYPDAVAFVSCHNNDYSTYYGSHVIWASSATYHMCNVAFRLVDKMTKAWLDKYGQTLKDAIDQYKINMDANDYRLGRATMSTSKGTEQLNATKYGIMGVNLEISRMMKVFSGNTDGTSEVMTHGAEVYANFMRTLLWSYDHKDKKEYAPNLPWSD